MTSAVVASPTFALPPSVVSKVDVSRLLGDLERIDNELTTIAVKAKAGAPAATAQPKISTRLNDFLVLNKLSLQGSNERSALVKQVRAMKDTLPTIHMTFAVEADPESLSRLAEWLRTTIHPQTVIAVGLQPGLVAGVYLRTPNHVHDLSLRAKLREGRGVLQKELEALRGAK